MWRNHVPSGDWPGNPRNIEPLNGKSMNILESNREISSQVGCGQSQNSSQNSTRFWYAGNYIGIPLYCFSHDTTAALGGYEFWSAVSVNVPVDISSYIQLVSIYIPVVPG